MKKLSAVKSTSQLRGIKSVCCNPEFCLGTTLLYIDIVRVCMLRLKPLSLEHTKKEIPNEVSELG